MNKNIAEQNPNTAILCLGEGKSRFFFTSLMPEATPVLALTNHPSPSSKIESYRDKGKTTDLKSTSNVLKAKKFVLDRITKGLPTEIVVTTDPERGKYWLDQLFKDKELEKICAGSGLVSFVLPQSPNSFVEDFVNTGCPVVQLDYYPGIGGVIHGEDGVARVKAGIKENTNYVIRTKPGVSLSQNRAHLDEVTKCLCGDQEIRRLEETAQINLPTNALLHTVGIVVHVVEELVKKGKIDASILEVGSAKDFFTELNRTLGNKSAQEINELLDGALWGKGFYKCMPKVGPDVLMKEMGNVVCEIRRREILNGKMKDSFLDEKVEAAELKESHIFRHLTGKYERQYEAKTEEKAHKVKGSSGNRVGHFRQVSSS